MVSLILKSPLKLMRFRPGSGPVSTLILILLLIKENVLRVPKRFVSTHADGISTVLIENGRDLATTTVEVLFIGNDSFLEVKGLDEGTIVVAP